MDNIVYRFLFLIHYETEELNEELRFNTVKYICENQNNSVANELLNKFCLDNKINKNDLLTEINKINNFVLNVEIKQFSQLVYDENTHVNYCEEKYNQMQNHTTYFIVTRDKVNYKKFYDAVVKFNL